MARRDITFESLGSLEAAEEQKRRLQAEFPDRKFGVSIQGGKGFAFAYAREIKPNTRGISRQALAMKIGFKFIHDDGRWRWVTRKLVGPAFDTIGEAARDAIRAYCDPDQSIKPDA